MELLTTVSGVELVNPLVEGFALFATAGFGPGDEPHVSISLVRDRRKAMALADDERLLMSDACPSQALLRDTINRNRNNLDAMVLVVSVASERLHLSLVLCDARAVEVKVKCQLVYSFLLL